MRKNAIMTIMLSLLFFTVNAFNNDSLVYGKQRTDNFEIKLVNAIDSANRSIVQNVSLSVSGENVTITWDEAADADSYQVYSSLFAYSGFSIDTVGVFTGTSWTTPVSSSKKFYYITSISSEHQIPASFVFVEGGTFNNGISNVTVSSFYIDKYEIQQSEYQTVMGVNPSSFANNPTRPVEQVSWLKTIEYSNRRSILEELNPCYTYSTYGTDPDDWPTDWYSSTNNHTNVSCNWNANGYRLPTEAEWQFAARGGILTNNYSYSGSNAIDSVAWYGSNANSATHIIGTKDPNELGVFDMTGNIAEWCWDIYGAYESGDQTDPTGPTVGIRRVYRGGSWGAFASSCTVSYRSYDFTATGGYTNGFRMVRKPL